MYGNAGIFLEVDLSTGQTEEIAVEEELYRLYIGGAGLAAKLLFDRGDLEAEPLDPESLLIFAAGPFADTGMYGTSRFSVCGRSPLTGVWGQSSCGGNFGPEMRRCGYDGIIFKGKAEKPVCLLLGNNSAELVDASDLWGKDVYEVTDALKEKYTKRHKVCTIGPASENGVLYGSITNDYGHHAGRAGLGTVMGSKNLKAIVAKGDRRAEFADPEGFKELWQNTIRPAIDESIFCQTIGAFGTGANMEMWMFEGHTPTKNWSRGLWEEGPETLSGIAMSDTILTERDTCRGCGVRCKRVVKVEDGPYQMEEGPGPEYETLGTFGTMLMNPSLEAVSKANEICNRLGMDTITCGATFAWAMSCYEHGIMKPEDYDGVKLEWGDIDTVIEMLPKIAGREGKLGELLAKGSRKASEETGGGSEAYLTDSKGLESPMHDPRCHWGNALAYVMSVRGACHVSNQMYVLEMGAAEYPEIGLDMILEGMSTEYKADAAAKTLALGSLTNSACWCQFAQVSVTLPMWVDAFNKVAGYDYDLDLMMKTGVRVWYLQRCLGHIWGAAAEDDTLGLGAMTPVEDGATAGSVPDLDTMIKEFREIRGLDEDNKPTRETLEAHDLGYLADRI
jgi:aldehyde:ferredoxin oxidoreductase